MKFSYNIGFIFESSLSVFYVIIQLAMWFFDVKLRTELNRCVDHGSQPWVVKVTVNSRIGLAHFDENRDQNPGRKPTYSIIFRPFRLSAAILFSNQLK